MNGEPQCAGFYHDVWSVVWSSSFRGILSVFVYSGFTILGAQWNVARYKRPGSGLGVYGVPKI